MYFRYHKYQFRQTNKYLNGLPLMTQLIACFNYNNTTKAKLAYW